MKCCRWQFIDWAPTQGAPCTRLTQCQLLHFGAHRLDGTPKPVWAVLKAGVAEPATTTTGAVAAMVEVAEPAPASEVV